MTNFEERIESFKNFVLGFCHEQLLGVCRGIEVYLSADPTQSKKGTVRLRSGPIPGNDQSEP